MKILIACEISGIIREAFRKVGHEAYSCDLLDSEIPSKYHIKDDVLKHLEESWDMMIAHPPCTHLCVSGAAWFKKKQKVQQEALEFVRKLMNAPIMRICIENPVSVISTQIKKPTQIIQPFDFGDPHQKTTCLWLKNLPQLDHTANLFDWQNLSYSPRVEPQMVIMKNGKKMSKFHYDTFFLPKDVRGKVRSRTFQGIADAMASQWGELIINATH